MKSSLITYINTTTNNKTIQVVLGNGNTQTIVLKPGMILNEHLVKTMFADPDLTLKNASVVGADGSFKSILPEKLDTPEKILQKSVLLDIETTSLRPGATQTQIAVTDLSTKRTDFFIPKPNFVATPSNMEMGNNFLENLVARKAKLPADMTVKELVFIEKYLEMTPGIGETPLKRARALDAGSNLDALKIKVGKEVDRISEYMIDTDIFQAKQHVHPGLLQQQGIDIDANERAFINKVLAGNVDDIEIKNYLEGKQGVLSVDEELKELKVHKAKPLRDIIRTDLPDLLKGKVTWIANANFESGQFGAQIRAEAHEAMEALNQARTLRGDPILDEKNFMQEFHRGNLSKEIAAINRSDKGDLYTRNPFINATAINPTTGKPFDTTGTGVFDMARAKALKTGDWSQVYESLLADTRPGDVRDVTDLTRALQSKLSNAGVLEIDRPTAMSVEIQARFALAARELRLAEEAGTELDSTRFTKALLSKETHFAVGDTLLSESPLMREQFDLLESLRKFEAGGDEAKELLRQAREGKGGLYRAWVVGRLQDEFNKPTTEQIQGGTRRVEGFDDVLFKQRAGKMLLDIAETGVTDIREDKPGFRNKQVVKEIDGIKQQVRLPAPRHRYPKLHTRDSIFTYLLEDLTDYGSADRDAHIAKLRADTERFFDTEGNLIPGKKDELYKYAKPLAESADKQVEVVEKRVSMLVQDDFFKAVRDFGGLTSHQRPAQSLTQGVATSDPGSRLRSVIAGDSLVDGALRKTIGRSLIGAAVLGLGFKVLDEVNDKLLAEKESNYIVPDFQEFMKAQSAFYGSKEAFISEMQRKFRVEGLQEQGLMAKIRSLATDFGSPYKGMGYSLSVLDDNKLRRERHKYEQAQFGARYFSAEGDVGFQLKRFVNSVFRKQMGIARHTEAMFFGDFKRITDSKYSSLRGDNLIEHKVDPSMVTVSDADTITIKRNGGANSPLSRFMGTGAQDSMTIRLAGIDAPETAHGDRSAQPYARMATQIATELINRAKDIRIVSRPDDTTYGRQVSMVYLDGKNLNLELVRRGAAAYLPYRGKGKAQFYSQEAFEGAQQIAQEAGRGMWADPYFQAYKMMSQTSGQSITFNTLVNASKVAKSTHLMNVASLMNKAQREGRISESLANELLETGEAQRSGASSSSRSIYSPDSIKGRWMSPELQTYGYNKNSINTILDQLKHEISGLQKTKGSKTTAETMRVARVSKNNLGLANKTLASASKEYNFERTNRVEEIQNNKVRSENRLLAMQEMQQTALRNQFNSPIAHHRM